MSEVANAVSIVRGRIQTYADKGIGEQNTKATLINPILRALGWELEDLEEVRLEFKLRAMDNPVDYAFMVQRTPRLFVEAKSLGGNVADPKWAGQIMGYAAVAGVEWVVLTDGDSWHIYNSHAAVPVDQKLFRGVRISEDAEAAETLSLLSKERMRDNLIDALWRAHFVDRQLRAGLEKAFGFGGDPDAALVRLIRKHAPQLTPADIRAGLGRAQVRFDFPSGPVEAPAKNRAPEAPPEAQEMKAPGKQRGVGTPWRNITLTDLVAAGLIRPPLDLTRRYRGQAVSARVEADGRVSTGGKRYTSLSVAAAWARVSVAGAFEGREYPQTNGWTFWQFRDSDGELREVDVLRRRLHERSGQASSSSG